MVAIALTIVGMDRWYFAHGTVVYQSLDIGYLAIDLFGAAATIALAFAAYRFWPMLMAVSHTLPLLGHFSRAVDISMHPIAYLTMQVAASWLLPPLLILATWGHQRRLKHSGSDPSWQPLSRPLSPNAAQN